MAFLSTRMQLELILRKRHRALHDGTWLEAPGEGGSRVNPSHLLDCESPACAASPGEALLNRFLEPLNTNAIPTRALSRAGTCWGGLPPGTRTSPSTDSHAGGLVACGRTDRPRQRWSVLGKLQ